MFPELELLRRSFNGRTHFVERFLPLLPMGFVWKSPLFCDLEDFDFLHLEIARTHENRPPLQSGVVGVSGVKGSVTAGACVAVIGNINVIPKGWTSSGITPDYPRNQRDEGALLPRTHTLETPLLLSVVFISNASPEQDTRGRSASLLFASL
jgi:hypothetical protein